MALDYAMNADVRRVPDADDPDDVATVARALAIYTESTLASASIDSDTSIPVDLSRISSATLVRTAEAAVDYLEDRQAYRALTDFFRTDPPQDQYYIRALFCRGLLRSRESRAYNGNAKVSVVKEAIVFILQGLLIAEDRTATNSGNYNFLIYNASVHHWSIARALLREGARAHAIPSFARVLAALTKADDPDLRWRSRQCIALATCHLETNEHEKALQYVTQALELLTKCGAVAASPGSSDYLVVEEASRLKSHLSALRDPLAAVATFDPTVSVPPAGAAAPGAKPGAAPAAAVLKPISVDGDVRANIMAALQPILTMTAPGQGSTGLSYQVGRDTTPAAMAADGTPSVPPARPPINRGAVRSRLLEMINALRPALHAEYTWRAAEAATGALKMAQPDFREVAAGAAASSSSSSSKGADLDLLGWIAQAAVQCGLYDVAHAAVHAVHEDKNSSGAALVLADVIDAQLLVACLSLEDAHQAVGHYVEIPADVIIAIAQAESGDAPGSGSPDATGKPRVRTRRQSVAMAMIPGFVPRRSSAGKALMMAGSMVQGTEIPAINGDMVAAIIKRRRVAALKPLKRCLTTAANLRDNSVLCELAATVTWNVCIPLLNSKDRQAAYPVLAAAADALASIDSPLYALRVRLHLEAAKGMRGQDLLAGAAQHVARALSLDYGGLRTDPSYSDVIRQTDGFTCEAPLPFPRYRPGDERELSLQRPLDRQLLPLSRAIALAGSTYDDPTDPLDQAAVTLQQAKAATDVGLVTTLLNKAASQLDQAGGLAKEAAAAWKRVRSPSFYIVSSDTAAVVSLLVGEDGAALRPTTSSSTGIAKAGSRPGTNKAGDRPGTGGSTKGAPANNAAPATSTASPTPVLHGPALPANPKGEAGGARRKQVHRLWLSLAEAAVVCGQWDLVLRACGEVRGYAWDPLTSREMVVAQARADILLATACAAKAKAYSAVVMEDKCREAAVLAAKQQVLRSHAAAEKLSKPTTTAASSAAVVGMSSPSRPGTSTLVKQDSASSAAALKKSAAEDATSKGVWWEKEGVSADDMAAHLDEAEVPDADEAGLLLDPAPFAPAAGEETDASALPPGAPRLYVPRETGHAPGEKPIPSDPHALGLIVPACPLPLTGWKVRLLSALTRCMRRGVALRTAWIVDTAAMQLWNAHMHVWQANDYGPAVLPQVMEAVQDALACLAAVGTSNGALVAKLAGALARYHEEATRAAVIDEALGLHAGSPAWLGINGAVLVDFSGSNGGNAPVTATAEVTEAGTSASKSALVSRPGKIPASDAASASHMSPEDCGALMTATQQILPSSAASAKACEAAACFATQLPYAMLHAAARRELTACVARARLYTLAGHGVAALRPALPRGGGSPATDATGSGTVSRPGTAAAKTAASAAAGSVASPVSGSALLDAVGKAGSDVHDGGGGTGPQAGAFDGSSSSGGDASASAAQPSRSSPSCSEIGRALALLQVTHHAGVSHADRVAALRSAITCVEKASAELQAVVDDVCGPSAERLRELQAAGAPAALAPVDPKSVRPASQAPGASRPGVAVTAPAASSASSVPLGPSRPVYPPGWGAGDVAVHGVNAIRNTPTSSAGVDAATYSMPTAAAIEASRVDMTRSSACLLAEMWARCAQAASDLAAESTKLQPPPPAAGANTTSAASSATSPPAASASCDPDLSLLADAQRCAAHCIASVPAGPGSKLRIDELGGLFGLKGHGYDAYRLSLGPEVVAKMSAGTASHHAVGDLVDIRVGRVGFFHRFGYGPSGQTIAGAGHGGYSTAVRWWSVAELAWGQAVMMLVNPDRQNMIEQDTLRTVALDHFVAAADWSSSVKDMPLVTAAAFLVWNLSLPLSASPVTRPPLLKPLHSLLTALAHAGGAAVQTHYSYQLRAELYRLLMTCYADETAWSDGLRVAEEAFTLLPPAYHDRLWKHKLTFQSKLGQDVTQALQALKSKSPSLQAKLWTSLARLAALPSDQGSAYLSALDTLHGMFSRCYVLIDYAEWLHANHMPVADVRDALHSAADVILRVADPADGSGLGDDDGGSVDGGGAGSSVISGSIRQQHTGRRSTAGGPTSSIADSSALRSSLAYSKPPPTVAGSQLTGGTRNGSVRSSLAPGRDHVEDASDWPSRLDISHVDSLIRIFAHLALVAESASERGQYLLMAAHWVVTAWEMSSTAINTAAAEKVYFKMRESERQVVGDYGAWIEAEIAAGPCHVPRDVSQWAQWWPAVVQYLAVVEDKVAKGVAADAGVANAAQQAPTTAVAATAPSSKPTVAAGPGSKSAAPSSAASRAGSAKVGKEAPAAAPSPAASATPPSTIEDAAEAASLEPAQQYCAMRAAVSVLPSAHASYGITASGIKSAPLTLHVLMWLADALCSLGFTLHAAPVLALAHAIGADVLQPVTARPVFASLVLAKTAAWLDAANCRAPAAAIYAWLVSSGSLTIDDDDRRIHEGEVILRDIGKDRRDVSLAYARAASPITGRAAMVSVVAAKRLKAALQGGNVVAGLRSATRRQVGTGEVRTAWAGLADMAVKLGMARGARQLLLEAGRHAVSFQDWSTLWSVKMLEAEIKTAEGDGRAAVDMMLEAVSTDNGGSSAGQHADATTWLRVVTLLATTLIRHKLHHDAKAVLQASLACFDAAAVPSTVQVPDLTQAQLDTLRNGGAGPAPKATSGRRVRTAMDATSALPDKASSAPSQQPDVDALTAAIRVRLMLAGVHTSEAIRSRRVGGSWMGDWQAADSLYAEAASISRQHGMDVGPCLTASLLEHARAVLSCPGADPDAFPSLANDAAFTGVADGTPEMAAMFRASSPSRRARLLYLGLACKLLGEAEAAASAWSTVTASSSAGGIAGPPPSDWMTPAARLSIEVRCASAYASSLACEEEVSAAIASERALYSGMASDPVALYLHQANAQSSDGTTGLQMVQVSPQRAGLAVSAAAAALAAAPSSLPALHASALAAYGCALRSLLVASAAASLPFTTAPLGSSESMLACAGAVELDRQLWEVSQPPPPASTDLQPASASSSSIADATGVASRPTSPTPSKPGSRAGSAAASAAPSKPGSAKAGGAAGKPAAAVAASTGQSSLPKPGCRTEFLPLPEANSAEAGLAVAVAASSDSTSSLLPDVVPVPLRTLHAQAVDRLQSALAFAASHRQWDAAGQAAASLLECYGSTAPDKSAVCLAMYQAVQARGDLREVFETAAGATSRQVLHMRLVDRMAAVHSHPADASPVYKAAIDYLDRSSMAWRMMDCSRRVEDVLAGLQFGTRIVVLQRSASGRVLYAAVMARTVTGIATGGSATPGLASAVARLALSDDDRALISQLCSDALGLRTEFAGHVRAMGEEKGARGEVAFEQPGTQKGSLFADDADAAAAPGAGGEDPTPSQPETTAHGSPPRPSSGLADRDVTEERVSDIIRRMSALLEPLFGINSSLGPWLAGSTGHVVVCAEKALFPLPLEALPCLSSAKAVVRDLSVQVLGHRLAAAAHLRAVGDSATPAVLPSSSSATSEPWYARPAPPVCNASSSGITFVADPRYEDKRDDADSNDEGAVDAVLARRTILESLQVLTGRQATPAEAAQAAAAAPAPADADQNAKGGKRAGTAAGKNPPTTPAKDASTAAEPLSDTTSVATGLAAKHPRYEEGLLEVLRRRVPLPVPGALGSAWKGFRGDTHIPSPAAWQEMMRTAPLRTAPDDPTGAACAGGAMLFYGQGRLFSYLPPETIAGLLCPSVRLAFLADSCTTTESARKQAIADNEKRGKEGRLDLEHTWETAALLSMTGVGTVVAQRWSTTHHALEALVHGGLSAAIVEGTPVAEAVKAVFDGHKDRAAHVQAKARVKYATVVLGVPQTCIHNA